MVTCRPTLLASTISGPISLSLGAPMSRKFISNSSCSTVVVSAQYGTQRTSRQTHLEDLHSLLDTFLAIGRHGIQERSIGRNRKLSLEPLAGEHSTPTDLPIPTAVAPRATALRTSDARLTPPSTMISKLGTGHIFRCLSSETTSTRTSIPDRANS